MGKSRSPIHPKLTLNHSFTARGRNGVRFTRGCVVKDATGQALSQKGLKGFGRIALMRLSRARKGRRNEKYCTLTRADPAVGFTYTDANAGGRKICKQALMTHPMEGKHRDLMKQCRAVQNAKLSRRPVARQKRSPLAPLVLVRSSPRNHEGAS